MQYVTPAPPLVELLKKSRQLRSLLSLNSDTAEKFRQSVEEWRNRKAQTSRKAHFPVLDRRNFMPVAPEEIAIAEWMCDELNRAGKLHQKCAVREIRERFHERYLYRNKRRRWAIGKAILVEFQKLRPADAVWSSRTQFWTLKRRVAGP